MHRDILRLLTYLAVIRVLVLLCSPSTRLTTSNFQSRAFGHRGTVCPPPLSPSRHDQALLRDVIRRRPARPSVPGRRETGGRPIRATDTVHVDAPPDMSGSEPRPRPGTQRRRQSCRRGRRAHARGKRGGGWRAAASTGLLIGTLNIQSLKPKLLELTHEANQSQYDLLILNETWLRPSIPNRLLTIPGYSLYRVDRPGGRGYGGVALLVRNQISAVTQSPVHGTCV